jgi:hypothetical protein
LSCAQPCTGMYTLPGCVHVLEGVFLLVRMFQTTRWAQRREEMTAKQYVNRYRMLCLVIKWNAGLDFLTDNHGHYIHTYMYTFTELQCWFQLCVLVCTGLLSDLNEKLICCGKTCMNTKWRITPVLLGNMWQPCDSHVIQLIPQWKLSQRQRISYKAIKAVK